MRILHGYYWGVRLFCSKTPPHRVALRSPCVLSNDLVKWMGNRPFVVRTLKKTESRLNASPFSKFYVQHRDWPGAFLTPNNCFSLGCPLLTYGWPHSTFHYAIKCLCLGFVQQIYPLLFGQLEIVYEQFYNGWLKVQFCPSYFNDLWFWGMAFGRAYDYVKKHKLNIMSVYSWQCHSIMLLGLPQRLWKNLYIEQTVCCVSVCSITSA